MKRSRQLLLALAALGATTLGAASARAQDLEPPRRRQGYYFALGAGTGAAQIWDDKLEKLPLAPGSRFSFRVGQLLTRRFGLGLNVETGGVKKDTKTTAQHGLGIEAHYELVTNLAVRAGVGLGVLQFRDSARLDQQGSRGAFGALYAAGVSYEWFPWKSDRSGGLAVTPSLSIRRLSEATGRSNSGFLTVEITWWTGLSKEQLELPESEAYKKKK